MRDIDWTSEGSLVLLNPRLPQSEQIAIQQAVNRFSHLKGHIWLSSSGSTALKWVALSKKALLHSAAAVNKHLECSSKDIWLNPLPRFHVGGLSVYARASLQGFLVIDAASIKWDPHAFHKMALDCKATVSALVPTQVFDLVAAGLKAPASLRAVVVGGGNFSEALYSQAKGLGWRLLPSYGLTECCSQVATASFDSLEDESIPRLKILDHFALTFDEEDCISVKGEALLTGYLDVGTLNFVDPKIEGVFQTEDLGKQEPNGLRLLGRKGNFVKISGESVDIIRLEQLLETIKLRLKVLVDSALVAMPHERLGHVIHLAAEAEMPRLLIDEFHQQVLPFERICCVHMCSIPRTPLGKLKRTELQQKIIGFERGS